MSDQSQPAEFAGHAFFFPALDVRLVLNRATEMARASAGHLVTLEILIAALVELHPDVMAEFVAPVIDGGLYGRLGRTNALLGALNQTVATLTYAMQANTQEETILVATLDDLTAVAQQITADDAALKTSLDAVVQALADAKAGGFTPEQQMALDSAVSGLQQAHTDLVADAQEATEAVTPPGPQG